MARQVKEYDERYQEFLDVGQRLFYTKGYDQTSIQEIIAAVGVAKGLFYYYFRAKGDLLDAIIERSENTIQAVLAGTTDESYPPEQKALDVEVYGAMHSLITTATSKGVPVIANDLGREGLLLNSVGAMTVGDLIERMDDTAGGDLLGSRADLSSSRSILVQRGSYHVWDLTYQDIPAVTNAGKGLDDYLQDKGRSVVVIGNYGSQDKLAGEVATLNNNGISVADASDATILGGQLIERPDLDLARRSLAPPTGGPSPSG